MNHQGEIMANYIVRATKDTTSQIGGAPSIIIGILGTLAGIGMQGWREGISAVSANIPTVLYGFAGLGLSAVLLFLYNLILAPFRCEREARLAIDDELKATQNRVAKLEQLKPNFVIEIEQVLFGETENADPRFLQCVVWVTIKNRGTPSIADRWSIYLQKGDQRSVGRICRLSGTMTFPNEVGHVVHEPSDAIENRTTDAIEHQN